MITRGSQRNLGGTLRALWLCGWIWMDWKLDWKMPQYCTGGWICSRVVCENTIVCVWVCVGGAERTLYMTPPPFNPILLPPISPVIVSDRRGWSLRVFTHPSVSSSSFSFLSSLLLHFSMHFCLGSIRHSSMQEVTSVVEGCLCALIHTGEGDSGDVRINSGRGHQGVQVQPFWAKFSN